VPGLRIALALDVATSLFFLAEVALAAVARGARSLLAPATVVNLLAVAVAGLHWFGDGLHAGNPRVLRVLRSARVVSRIALTQKVKVGHGVLGAEALHRLDDNDLWYSLLLLLLVTLLGGFVSGPCLHWTDALHDVAAYAAIVLLVRWKAGGNRRLVREVFVDRLRAVRSRGRVGPRVSGRTPRATEGTLMHRSSTARTLVIALPLAAAMAASLLPSTARAQFGASVSGTVFDVSNNPVSDAFVQVCPTGGGSCALGLSNPVGGYSISGIAPGTYAVTAFPPAGSDLIRDTVPIEIVSLSLTGIDLILTPPLALPPGTTITPSRSGGGVVPTVYWHNALTLTTPGCVGGAASYAVQDAGGSIANGSLLEAASGTYSGSIPPFFPQHGYATVTFSIGCQDGSTENAAFNIYIDPSGRVVTTLGAPVPGATVTLLRSDEPGGPFVVVPDGDAVMSPANRTNPMLSDDQGHWGWDTVTGFYVVRAEAAGCTSPDGSSSFVESAVLTIPPPVTDLDLVLDCGGPVQCDVTCATCSGPASSQCTSCPAGRFLDTATGTCGACHPTCVTCAGPTATDCLSCGAGHILDGGACCPDANQDNECDGDRVALVDLVATRDGDGVRVTWVTGSELGCGHFELLRCDLGTGDCPLAAHAATPGIAPVPCADSLAGARYEVRDAGAAATRGWSYLLREHETTGAILHYGPLRLPAGVSEARWSPAGGSPPRDGLTPPADAPGVAGGGCRATLAPPGPLVVAALLAFGAVAARRRRGPARRGGASPCVAGRDRPSRALVPPPER
jgi:hypothetical protein